MQPDRLNQRLSLIANFGVIVGLVFLIAELDQANRIARFTAENEMNSMSVQINTNLIASSEVWAKLQANDAELAPSDRAKAVMIARQLINAWYNTESAYNNGLLSDVSFQVAFLDISVVAEEAPGLIPFLAYVVNVYDVSDDQSLVNKRLLEVVEGAEY